MHSLCKELQAQDPFDPSRPAGPGDAVVLDLGPLGAGRAGGLAECVEGGAWIVGTPGELRDAGAVRAADESLGSEVVIAF